LIKIFFHDWHVYDINKIIRKAKKLPISWEKVEQVMLGQIEDLCYNPEYSVEIYVGIRCGCFFEYCKGTGEKHQRVFVTFDQEDLVPHPESVVSIMEIFGLNKKMSECDISFLRVKDKPTVINIFEK
jgi:hypothetical protein